MAVKMDATIHLPLSRFIPSRAAPIKPRSRPLSLSNPKQGLSIRCYCSDPPIITTAEPKPVSTSVCSFAPATFANLGPCFGFLGCAVGSIGDYVTVCLDPTVDPGEISISEISGPHATPKLSKEPFSNSAGIAGIAVMKMLNIRSVGLSLNIKRRLPPDRGLGSNASIAAAAAVSINEMFGNKLSLEQLVHAGIQSEITLSGYHANNIAPALMGGFVLVRNYEPLELKKLNFPADKNLLFVLVIPEFEVAARKMREMLHTEIGMAHHVWNSSQSAALVVAVLEGDLEGLGKAMNADKIIERQRASLIPGMAAVKKAAIEAGAFGCTISGSGPTMVALVDDEEMGREVGKRMEEAFLKEGNLRAVTFVARLDRVGARRVDSVRSRYW